MKSFRAGIAAIFSFGLIYLCPAPLLHGQDPPAAVPQPGAGKWKVIGPLKPAVREAMKALTSIPPETVEYAEQGEANKALWEKVLPEINAAQPGEIINYLLVDPSGRRFTRKSFAADGPDEEVAATIVAAVKAYEPLLIAKARWEADPTEQHRQDLVKQLVVVSPAFRRSDYKDLLAKLGSGGGSGQSSPTPLTPSTPPGTPSTLDALHFEMLQKVEKPWKADNEAEVFAGIDAFIAEKKVDLETRQKLEMHKYRFHSVSKRFAEALVQLEKVRLIAPDSPLAKRIPGMAAKLTAAMEAAKNAPPEPPAPTPEPPAEGSASPEAPPPATARAPGGDAPSQPGK